MIRRPPRSTLSSSSAASDVYKRQEYEWVQFNKQLRLIRSVKDDMYQMQSILTACFAPDTKHTDDWFKNQSTQELLSEISLDREFSALHKTHENRKKKLYEIISFIQDEKLKLVFIFFIFLFCM